VAIYAAAAAASEMYGMYRGWATTAADLTRYLKGRQRRQGNVFLFFVWFKLLRALWGTFRQQDKERDYQ